MLTPFSQQLAAVEAAGTAREFAFFMETGTGKTGAALLWAHKLWRARLIRQLLVVAPNGIHKDWIRDHLPLWWPDEEPIQAAYHSTANLKTERLAVESLFVTDTNVFKILTVNIEAIPFHKHFDLLSKFLRRAPTLVTLDESDLIRKASGRWTECMYALGRRAAHRLIMTGTEIGEGPFDLYTQFQFLKWGLLGHTTYATFKARYAVWRERHAGMYVDKKGQLKERVFPELVHYQNLDELREKIRPYSFRALKKDCLDLPEQLFTKRTVVLTPEVRAIYNEVKARVFAELPAGSVTTAHAFTKLTRLCQVTGGTIQYDDASAPIFLTAGNAKLNALQEITERLPAGTGVIVWARYLPELNGIYRLLNGMFPGSISRYWGEIDAATRDREATAFKEGRSRVMVAQQHAGGRGHTWLHGRLVIYYSNDFSYITRKQSEDRPHRIGQTEKVTYIDLVAEGTTDVKIWTALAEKKNVADYFQYVKEFIE